MKKFFFKINNSSGFSLIEVLIALAVGSVIMLMIYSAHRSIITTITDITSIAEFHENINLVIRRMELDITGMYINPDNKYLTFSGENQTGELKKGSISFVTINPHGRVANGDFSSESRETDIKTVRYYLKPDPKFPELFFLMRQEKNLYEKKETDESDKADEITSFDSFMLDNVVDLSFEFAAEQKWDSRWETNQPPRAIRVTLRVKNYHNKDEERFVFIATPSMK